MGLDDDVFQTMNVSYTLHPVESYMSHRFFAECVDCKLVIGETTDHTGARHFKHDCPLKKKAT